MHYIKCKFVKFNSFKSMNSVLCLMKSNISMCTGSSRYCWSMYMSRSHAMLNSCSLGTEVTTGQCIEEASCVGMCALSPHPTDSDADNGIFGCARYNWTWSSAASATAVSAPPICNSPNTCQTQAASVSGRFIVGGSLPLPSVASTEVHE